MKLIDAVNREAKRRRGDPMIFLSHSQDPKRNPLTYDQKIKWAKKSTKFPKSIIKSRAINLFEVLQDVYDKGYTDLVIVVGADRIPEFKALSGKYNGVKARHGFYNFDRIDVVSAGDRDPDAEGVEGMSASKMRAAVMQDDFESFRMGVSPKLSDRDVELYYQDLKDGMNLREWTAFKDFIQEKWVMTTKTAHGDKTVEIFKNPTSREIASIPSYGSMKAVRAVVDNKGDFYAFDINLLHSRAVQVLDLPTNVGATARIIVSWDDRKIRPSSTDSPMAMGYYLPKSKWVQQNLKGFDALVEELEEEWFTTGQSYGRTYEVFKNPSSKELRDIESFRNESVVRAIIVPNGDIFVFDVDFLHEEGLHVIEAEFGKHFLKKAKIVLNFKDQMISLSSADNADNVIPYLKKSRWIQRNCKGWFFTGMDKGWKKQISFIIEENDIYEKAEYNGKKVTLNKPFRTSGESKKFAVYAKNDKGNVVMVRFGDPNMEIKRDDDARRKSFRARHNCADPGPKWKARYWSCKMWEKGKSVSDITDQLQSIAQSVISDS